MKIVAIEKGVKPLIFLQDHTEKYLSLEHDIREHLSTSGQGYISLRTGILHDGTREKEYSLLYESLIEHGIRHAHFVGFGGATSLLQMLAVRHRKLPRSLTLIDATLRPYPTFMARVIDWLERFLPLGLPFRSASEVFDVASYIHRIRMPCLMIETRSIFSAGVFSPTVFPSTPQQSERILQHLPLAWKLLADSSNTSRQIAEAVTCLMEVPLKCPQKSINSSL